MAAKFRKLMGIKKGEGGLEDEEAEDPQPGTSGGATPAAAVRNPKAEELERKQNELFHQLDKEYEFARMTTHTHRGVGLGFASHVMPNFPK